MISKEVMIRSIILKYGKSCDTTNDFIRCIETENYINVFHKFSFLMSK